MALYTEAKKLRHKSRRLHVSSASIKRRLLEAKKVIRSQNIEQLTRNLTPFQNRFFHCQMNVYKKLQGRTYTVEEKMDSLSLWKSSSSMYNKLNRLGFNLPTAATLWKLMCKIPLKPGISNIVFDSIEKIAVKMSAKEKHCILIFDEIAIKLHLDYLSYVDEIEGFQSTTKYIADHATVLMLRGIFKKWKQPDAYIFHKSSILSETVVDYL